MEFVEVAFKFPNFVNKSKFFKFNLNCSKFKIFSFKAKGFHLFKLSGQKVLINPSESIISIFKFKINKKINKFFVDVSAIFFAIIKILFK